MEQKVAWAPHTPGPLVTHMYEHTCTDTDCHTHIRTGTHTPHRQSHTNTPAELGWGRGEQCMLRGPCSPCLRTLASLGSAHPTPGASGLSWPSSPCPLSPNANDQGSRNRPCCPAVPAHPTGLLPPPFDSGHAWGPPAWPIHRQGSLPPPNLPGPPTRPPAPLAAPRVLPAPSDGTPQSCLQSSRAAQGHQGHSRHLCPPPPLQEAPAHWGLTPPQPTYPGWTAPGQSPALRRPHTGLRELRGGG